MKYYKFTSNNKNYLKKSILKFKIKGFKNNSGKNHHGKTTVFHKGGGHKRKLRMLDFSRNIDSTGIVLSIEYDPNRNSFISAIYDFINKKYYYILTPKNLKVGDLVKSGIYADLKLGNSLHLYKINVGTLLHNISLSDTNKGVISRSAGNYSILLEKNKKNAKLKVSSGKIINVSLDRIATIGVVSNENYFLKIIGKAGRSRWLNKRPVVRGVAMNPIDHPHGGGEGKTSGGKIHLTPWGKPTKHFKTSK